MNRETLGWVLKFWLLKVWIDPQYCERYLASIKFRNTAPSQSIRYEINYSNETNFEKETKFLVNLYMVNIFKKSKRQSNESNEKFNTMILKFFVL